MASARRVEPSNQVHREGQGVQDNGQRREVEINLGLLIAVLALAPIAAVGLALLPRIWASDAIGPPPQERRRRWTFREARQEANARVLPSVIFAVTALVVSMGAELLREATDGTMADVAGQVALWAFVAFLGFLLAALSVTLFNVPKLIVPPAVRDEAGALALWWRGRRARR